MNAIEALRDALQDCIWFTYRDPADLRAAITVAHQAAVASQLPPETIKEIRRVLLRMVRDPAREIPHLQAWQDELLLLATGKTTKTTPAKADSKRTKTTKPPAKVGKFLARLKQLRRDPRHGEKRAIALDICNGNLAAAMTLERQARKYKAD